MSLRSFYYFLSPSMRLFVRKAFYMPVDFFETLTNKSSKDAPKKGDIFIGSGDFIKQGKHQLDLLVHYVGLKASNHVLDVGCGIGRTAVALKSFLTPEGKYDGFDVVEKGIVWCKKNISPHFPNFNFKYVPLNNDLYTSRNEQADQFKFPYQDNTFDTVYLFSVFTHMQPSEVQNYLSEINRVLKPDGKCLATFFIYNQENEIKIADKKGSFNFPFQKKGYRLMNEKVTSANIAFSETMISEMMQKSNLKLLKHIDGTWKKPYKIENLSDFQDILVLQK